MSELFHCIPYDCRLLPEACARRQFLAVAPQRPGEPARDHLALCVGCPQGQAVVKELGDKPLLKIKPRKQGAIRQRNIRRDDKILTKLVKAKRDALLEKAGYPLDP